MGFSKTFLLLGLAFAVVVLLTSSDEVSAARELAAQTKEMAQTNVGETNFGDHHGHGHGHGNNHGHGGHGHHGGGEPGHGGHHGHDAAKTQEVVTETKAEENN
ncbi:hypothetical protein ACOSP7_030288 [Xanthoceras sorbifolium]